MYSAKMRGKLFVMSGPSGTGKGTICKELLSSYDPEELALSISMTTRQPRNGEIDGVSYFFSTKEEFQESIQKDDFIEYAEVFGNFYGTPKSKVYEKLDNGTDILLEIDVQGALQVKEKLPEAVLIFILPPSLEELEKRIVGRATDSEEVIMKRLAKAEYEISFAEQYDYKVINDELYRAVEEIRGIIAEEHSRI